LQKRYAHSEMAARWRRGRRRISGKRLRSIEVMKSQAMSNRAIAHRLGVSEMAICKLIGPSFDQRRTVPKRSRGAPTPWGWDRFDHKVERTFDIKLHTLLASR
jgi:hypothetical protein